MRLVGIEVGTLDVRSQAANLSPHRKVKAPAPTSKES